jgi:hypothetical protein
MPTTFLLVTLIAALGAISPIFAAATLLFCLVDRFNRLGLNALKLGSALGLVFIVGWALLTLVFISHPDHRLLAIALFFGAGFTLGSTIVFARHLLRRQTA